MIHVSESDDKDCQNHFGRAGRGTGRFAGHSAHYGLPNGTMSVLRLRLRDAACVQPWEVSLFLLYSRSDKYSLMCSTQDNSRMRTQLWGSGVEDPLMRWPHVRRSPTVTNVDNTSIVFCIGLACKCGAPTGSDVCGLEVEGFRRHGIPQCCLIHTDKFNLTQAEHVAVCCVIHVGNIQSHTGRTRSGGASRGGALNDPIVEEAAHVASLLSAATRQVH